MRSRRHQPTDRRPIRSRPESREDGRLPIDCPRGKQTSSRSHEGGRQRCGHLAGAAQAACPRDVAQRPFEVGPREIAPGFYDTVVGTCRTAGFEPRLDEQAAGNIVWASSRAAAESHYPPAISASPGRVPNSATAAPSDSIAA